MFIANIPVFLIHKPTQLYSYIYLPKSNCDPKKQENLEVMAELKVQWPRTYNEPVKFLPQFS